MFFLYVFCLVVDAVVLFLCFCLLCVLRLCFLLKYCCFWFRFCCCLWLLSRVHWVSIVLLVRLPFFCCSFLSCVFGFVVASCLLLFVVVFLLLPRVFALCVCCCMLAFVGFFARTLLPLFCAFASALCFPL